MNSYEFNKHGTILDGPYYNCHTRPVVHFYYKNKEQYNRSVLDGWGSLESIKDTTVFGHIRIPQEKSASAEIIIKTFIRAGIYWGTYELKQI